MDYVFISQSVSVYFRRVFLLVSRQDNKNAIKWIRSEVTTVHLHVPWLSVTVCHVPLELQSGSSGLYNLFSISLSPDLNDHDYCPNVYLLTVKLLFRKRKLVLNGLVMTLSSLRLIVRPPLFIDWYNHCQWFTHCISRWVVRWSGDSDYWCGHEADRQYGCEVDLPWSTIL